MIASPNRSTLGTTGGRRILVLFLLVSVLGGVVFLITRHRPAPTAPLPEVHRKDLELRARSWYMPGQTNGFTGFLLTTYDDGALKSRSAVSNGLPQGLSEGWHTNGQQQVEEYFHAGLSHGLRSKWHENGRLLSKVMIMEGKLEGTFQQWHPDGTLAEQVELKAGVPDGISRAYYPSGFLKSEVHLREGEVLDQEFWKDGEHRAAGLVANGSPARIGN